MNNIIGKKAYKKTGHFSGLIGIVAESDSGITPYKLVLPVGGSIAVTIDDIVFID